MAFEQLIVDQANRPLFLQPDGYIAYSDSGGNLALFCNHCGNIISEREFIAEGNCIWCHTTIMSLLKMDEDAVLVEDIKYSQYKQRENNANKT